jgi:hypothetical protein
VGILRTVAAPKGHDEANDLAAFLKSGPHEWQIDEVGEERARGNEEVAAGYENLEGEAGKVREEDPEALTVSVIENRESRERAPLATVERGRDAPDTTVTVAEFFLFSRGVLLEAVRGIGDDGVNRAFPPTLHPGEAIVEVKGIGTGISLGREALSHDHAPPPYDRGHFTCNLYIPSYV